MNKIFSYFLKNVFFLFLFFQNANIVNAASIQSNGTGGGTFNVTTTWSGGIVPTASDTAVIIGSDIVKLSVATNLVGLRILSAAKFDNNGFQLSLLNTNMTALYYIVYGEHNITGNVRYKGAGGASSSSFHFVGPSTGTPALISGSGEWRTSDCVHDTITGLFNFTDANLVVGYNNEGCGGAVLINYGNLTFTNGSINVNKYGPQMTHNFINRGTITLTNGNLNLGNVSVSNSARFVNESILNIINGNINYLSTNSSNFVKNISSGIITLTNGSINIYNASYFYNYGSITLAGINKVGNNVSAIAVFANFVGSTLTISGLGEPIFPGCQQCAFAFNWAGSATVHGVSSVIYDGAGDQFIRMPSNMSGGLTTYWNVTCSNSGVKRIKTNNLNVLGDLKILGNAVLDASEDDGVANYLVDLAGDWIDNSTVTPSFIPWDQAVIFSGIGTSQSITSNDVGGATFYDVVNYNYELNLLNSSINIVNNLIFVTGNINTGSYECNVTNPDPAAIAGYANLANGNYSSGSYINGNLRRSILSSGGVYDFPVGNSYGHQMATVDFTSSHTVNNLLVNFSNLATGSGLPLSEYGNSFLSLLRCGGNSSGIPNSLPGVWTITPDTGTAIYDLTLNGLNYSNSGAVNTIVKRISSLTDWFLLGVFGSDSGTEPLVVNRTNYSGFSQFAIACNVVALPIGLETFYLNCEKDKNKLNWSTISEINNDFFEIQKTLDGINFTAIGKIIGAGNSNHSIKYEFTDTEYSRDLAYYRLKQIDFDGKYSYSEIISNRCSNLSNTSSSNLFPNPFANKSSIHLANYKNQIVHLQISDLFGKIIFKEEINESDLENSDRELDLNGFESGIYTLLIVGEFDNETIIMIKE